MRELTNWEREDLTNAVRVYKEIKRGILETGKSPTTRELRTRLNMANETISKYIELLERTGFIKLNSDSQTNYTKITLLK